MSVHPQIGLFLGLVISAFIIALMKRNVFDWGLFAGELITALLAVGMWALRE